MIIPTAIVFYNRIKTFLNYSVVRNVFSLLDTSVAFYKTIRPNQWSGIIELVNDGQKGTVTHRLNYT